MRVVILLFTYFIYKGTASCNVCLVMWSVAHRGVVGEDSVPSCGKDPLATADGLPSRPVFSLGADEDRSLPASETASGAAPVPEDVSVRDVPGSKVVETGDSSVKVSTPKCQPADTVVSSVATPAIHKSASKYVGM